MGLINTSATAGGGRLLRPQPIQQPGGMGGGMGGGGMGAPVPTSARNPTGPASPGYQPFQRAAPAQTQMQMPQYQAPPPVQRPPTYQPQASPVSQDLRELSGRGGELMDPNSDYYKELVSQMRGDIGKSTAASKRGAALMGAEQGFGAGASPEMMSVMGDIGEAGRIAEGEAMGDLSLAAPQLGASMMSSTFGPGVSLEGMGEQSRQFGAGLGESGQLARAGMAEGARQFGTGVGLQQQGMAQERAQREAEMKNQWSQWEAEFGLREDAMAAEYGAYGDGYGDEYGAVAANRGGIGY